MSGDDQDGDQGVQDADQDAVQGVQGVRSRRDGRGVQGVVQGVQDDGSRTVGDRPDRDDQDDGSRAGRPESGDLAVPADPADRLSLARAEYQDLLRRLDLLRDPDPVVRRMARQDHDRRVRELRRLSPWYSMLAERSRRIFMARQDEYVRYWADQRRRRRESRRPAI